MEKAIKKVWPIFLLPTLAAFLLGFVIPFGQGLYLSLCKFTTVNKVTFIGFSNYINAVKDPLFANSFWYTARFTIVSTLLINIIALAIAVALTKEIKGTNLFRTVFFMPNLIGGNPNHASEMLALNIYNTFYVRSGSQWKGIGQAKAVILCILVVAISMIQLKTTRSKEVQQ